MSSSNITLTDVWRAARKNDVEEITRLVEAGNDINGTFRDDATALHFACALGHAEAVCALLRLKASLNVKTHYLQWTPLHHAAAYGHAEIVRMLLRAGARAMLTDRNGESPSQLALKRKHREVYALLKTFETSGVVLS